MNLNERAVNQAIAEVEAKKDAAEARMNAAEVMLACWTEVNRFYRVQNVLIVYETQILFRTEGPVNPGRSSTPPAA